MTATAENLSAVLSSQGFVRVPLRATRVGHFETDGVCAGRPVQVLVDTGAASTVIDLEVARTFGLDPVSTGRSGAGAGGAQLPIHAVTGARLTLAGLEVMPGTVAALDLTHVAAGLAARGVPPPQVILGADVLAARAAIIDYGSNSLWLRR